MNYALDSSCYIFRLSRLQPGQERETASQLRVEGHSAFILLGRYDLLVVDRVERLDAPTSEPLSATVLARTEVTAIQSAGKEPVERHLDEPAIAVTLVRTLPTDPSGVSTITDALQLEAVLATELPEASVLHSLATTDLVIVQSGSNPTELLSAITRVRDAACAQIGSTTTMIGIHPGRIHKIPADERLRIRIGVRSRPSYEQDVCTLLGCGPGLNAYGPQDAVVDDSTGDLAAVLDKVLAARDPRTGAADTAIALFAELGLPTPCVDESRPADSDYAARVKATVVSQIAELRELAGTAENELAALLAELASDVAAASTTAEYGGLGLEQIYTLDLVILLVRDTLSLGAVTPENVEQFYFARFDLRQIIHHLALSIYQRSSGGDPHYNWGSTTLSLATRCQARLAAAVTAPIWFAIRAVMGEKNIPLSVGFGNYYSPTWTPGVIGLPDYSLETPIEQWWKTVHEVGHAVATAKSFFNSYASPELQKYAGTMATGGSLDITQIQDFYDELFAQWFDFHMAFGEDEAYYQRSIWSSWLQLPFVWTNRAAYVARSLGIRLYARREEVEPIKGVYRAKRDYVEQVLLDLRDDVGADVPLLGQYLDTLPEDERDIALDMACDWCVSAIAPLAQFEKSLFDGRLDAYADLETHARLIVDGSVITEGIRNPAALIVACKKIVDEEQDGVAAASSQFALVLSLWNLQQKAQAAQVLKPETLFRLKANGQLVYSCDFA